MKTLKWMNVKKGNLFIITINNKYDISEWQRTEL